MKLTTKDSTIVFTYYLDILGVYTLLRSEI